MREKVPKNQIIKIEPQFQCTVCNLLFMGENFGDS